MFFHQFIRTSNVVENLLEGKAAIIFFLDPSSEDGHTLLDDSFCSPLGAYGERKNINLLFSQGGSEDYSRFIASIFDVLADSTDELPQVPAIIIVRSHSSNTQVDILSEYEARDRKVLRKDIYALMDALSSSDADKSLLFWQHRRQVRRLSINLASIAERLLEFLK